jgi:hypothetical protein
VRGSGVHLALGCAHQHPVLWPGQAALAAPLSLRKLERVRVGQAKRKECVACCEVRAQRINAFGVPANLSPVAVTRCALIFPYVYPFC